MILRRLQLGLLSMLAAGSVWASSADLMPGSVPFYNYLLWDKAVKFGFDDNGNYTGQTRWYTANTNGDCHATISVRRDVSCGKMTLESDGDAHRSFNVLNQPGEMAGPAATKGLKLSSGTMYFDAIVSLDTYTEPFERTDSRDKLNCWIYIKDDGSVTNFMITAGSIVSTNTVAATNYVIDASVLPGSEMRLTLKAIGDAFTTNCPGLIGFEVYLDGQRVSSVDGTTVFPSAVNPSAEDGQHLHSLGLTGQSTASRINYTHSDPIDDPEYYQDDVSMLCESADITITGYPGVESSLIDFPMLVRVSEENIPGFYYSRCSSYGLDIRFTDENGFIIPHEIECWNPGGESIFWVKVPYFRRDAKITMHWALTPSAAAPENNRYAVWSDYIGVWHFALDDHGWVSLEDSTGNDYNLCTVGEKLTSVDSKIGTAGYAVAATNFVSRDFSKLFPAVANTFTFTGWYKWQNGDRYQSTTKIAGKTDANVYGAKMHGWTLVTPKETKARFYADGCSQSQGADTPEAFSGLKEDWGHVGLVYDGGVATAYANACAGSPTNMVISLVTNLMQTMTAGIAADELRITAKARSSSWIAAECMQATNVNFLTYGFGNVKERGNYWIVEPSASVSPPAVSIEDADTLTFSPGQPRYGTAVLRYYDVNGVALESKPTDVGTYKAVTTVEAGIHDGLRHEIAFVIFEKRAYHDIAGYDRVMLFNSDTSAVASVVMQGYNDVDSALTNVWDHGDSSEMDYAWSSTGLEESYPFVLDGVDHRYYEPNTGRTKLIWQFLNCRVGNLYPQDDEYTPGATPLMDPGMHYLPWGGDGAMRVKDSQKRCTAPRYAGMLLMRNYSLPMAGGVEAKQAEVAAVYSPLYTNGIGTIYFDAVNVYGECVNQLKVQYCSKYWDDEPWYPGAGGWQDLPVDVFAITDGIYDESLSTSGVTTVTLAMDDMSGTCASFYRIRAHVGINTNVRFRIVRCDSSSSMSSDLDYPVGMIAIDNIIVSYPGMGAKISQYGAPAEPNNLTLRGQRAPFDVAFPTADDLGQMHAQIKVDYIVNNTNEIDTSFIGAITFRYRWRYLEQLVNSWREVTLAADPSDPHRWVSNEPIIGDGVGDIEYEATAIINAPYYAYYDYSGLYGWVWPDGFSERYGNQTIDAEADGVYSDANLSPALGKDYFVRLRDGASEYEGIRVIIRRTNQSYADPTVSEETVDLTPTSDHTWRGYYNVETNGLANVFYRVEAYNRQTEVGVDYQWNTNYMHGVDQDSLPASDVWETGETNVWTLIPCDELTGKIMFQVDDNSFAASIIHADYQDFNAWSDAKLDSGVFLGTSAQSGTSGVSRAVRDYFCGFDGFRESVATNSAWNESFYLSSAVTNEGGYAINVPFDSASTPNGWGAEYGMWVCERYQEMGGHSLALHLNSRYGKLTMHSNGEVALPRGVDTFSYVARTAQNYDSRPFNYYNLATNELFTLPGMTFAVPCSMCTTGIDSEFHGLGSVSAVIRYRDSVGGYEVRADRVGSNRVELCLYKWISSSPYLVGKSQAQIEYTGESNRSSAMGTIGLGESRRCYGALLISVTNTPTSVRITAGILGGKGRMITDSLDGSDFFLLRWEDTDDDRFLDGTVGVGSKECPAVFAHPVYSTKAVPWTTAGGVELADHFYYWDEASKVNIHSERQLLETSEDYNSWNIYPERLVRKDSSVAPRNMPGFKAKPLRQEIYVQGSANGTGSWVTLATNVVESFNFVRFDNVFRDCTTYLMQLKVGGSDGGAAVVIDEASLCQWRGEDYDDENNPDRLLFNYNIDRGSPTNFVYTTAWVAEDDGPIELTPLRTQVGRKMSIRSPLMDGDKSTKRGLGLGAFSFRYEYADRHARLLLQIATNNIDITSLKSQTSATLDDTLSSWETVKTITFDQLSQEELDGGLVSCYLGLHGITGVMRIIVDPTLVAEANDLEYNPGRDPAYGRIYVTMVAAKDNPKLDSGSWWGWNLRTTDEGSKQLLKDGDLDPRLYGLSYALNNSVTASTRDTDIYVTHKPFLQTPILTRGSIGEVSFKARKYAVGDPAPSIAIYAMKEYDPAAKDGKFVYLTNIVVNCERYERFSFMAPVSENYTAFRFAVTGVEGVEGDGTPDGAGPMPSTGFVRRVLLDEVSVFEALKARLGFRKVGAFRNMLGVEGVVPNVPSRSEQPICKESWGIQAELYAVRLSEKIDYDRTPKVYLHWFENYTPWGYELWKDNSNAHTVELKPATAGSLVYRSSLVTCPDAVLPAATYNNATFQYMLEVVYYMQDQSTAMTNFLESSEWSTPEWYRPIDYNVQYGQGERFAAYNIIDSVPSGWAWINEVNLFGTKSGSVLSDSKNQYIEVACPIEADLRGWTLRLLTPLYNKVAPFVYTNELAKFGTTKYTSTAGAGTITLASTKDVKYAASNMVFLCVASPLTFEDKKLTKSNGKLDGAWKKPSGKDAQHALQSDGQIQYYQGLGLQLVRPSGIVEHEIVAIGTNWWEGTSFETDANPTNAVRQFNQHMDKAQFFYAGSDNAGSGKSLGVFDSFGESADYWNNTMVETPGSINQFQFIDPDHPVPIGSFVTVYFNLTGDHIVQTVGAGVKTNVSQICFVRKGSAVGTNVVYDIDQWYELAEVNSSDGVEIWPYSPNVRQAHVAAAVDSQANSITITAKAQVSKQLRDLDCTDQNQYTPAIIDWLEKHTFLKDVYGIGTDWPDSDGQIYLADFMGLNRQIVSQMTLTQMYWLDICPTISNQCLVAGMATPPSTKIEGYESYDGTESVTNQKMSVFMMLTNTIEDADSPYYAKAWSPYVLRGLTPGYHSQLFDSASSKPWTNVTFKITGILANGLTDENSKTAWVPQRYFVFNDNSFSNFLSTVKVPDPHSTRSLGYQYGWGEWWRRHPDDRSPVFFSWAIDTSMKPVGIDVLRFDDAK